MWKRPLMLAVIKRALIPWTAIAIFCTEKRMSTLYFHKYIHSLPLVFYSLHVIALSCFQKPFSSLSHVLFEAQGKNADLCSGTQCYLHGKYGQFPLVTTFIFIMDTALEIWTAHKKLWMGGNPNLHLLWLHVNNVTLYYHQQDCVLGCQLGILPEFQPISKL